VSPSTDTLAFDLATLRAAYRSGLTPADAVRAVYRRVRAAGDNPIWITLVAEEQAMTRAAEIIRLSPDSLPLYGIPFAVKDNIDAAGMPTTAACPDFAYVPEVSASVVECLTAAGAILIGKTNLDQFATGLVGTRSPYGEVRNALHPDYVSGGSSSGSAVAVALGLVSFALGTDTAGSGRVPAAFNNIVGLKPTRGLVPTRGVVPACRSLDCVSIFAGNAGDARLVLEVVQGTDALPHRSRQIAGQPAPEGLRLGVPRPADLEWFGDAESPALFARAVECLERLGAALVPVDYTPFREAAMLLYGGPWVAERYAGIREFFESRPDALLPVTREIIGGAAKYSAADAFAAQYRLAEIAAATAPVWKEIDALILPTTPTIYTREEVAQSPIATNANFGLYTNFVNLLDLAAIAVPAGARGNGLPFGISFIAPAGSDRWLCELGARYHASWGSSMGATSWPVPAAADARVSQSAGKDGIKGGIRIAVVGAHLSGQPLNRELTRRGARLIGTARTDSAYRLYALATTPPKPGLIRSDGGVAVELEIWELGESEFGSFVADIPAPMAIGTLTLADGSAVKGFLCEPHATRGAEDISAFGGWRAYLDARRARRTGTA